jgi:hypothetical protein
MTSFSNYGSDFPDHQTIQAHQMVNSEKYFRRYNELPCNDNPSVDLNQVSACESNVTKFLLSGPPFIESTDLKPT